MPRHALDSVYCPDRVEAIGKLRSILVPGAKTGELKRAGLLAVAGALAAGVFGIIHDQITYTISPEYFTRMKFDQFHGADFGFPERVFVAEIGFLATWWVGFIGAWFLARVSLGKHPDGCQRVLKALGIVILVASVCGFSGYFAGPVVVGNDLPWNEALVSMGVVDQTAFNRVAGIHTGSYAGAFLGWLGTMAWLKWR